MTIFRRIAPLKPGLPGDNHIIAEWQHPSRQDAGEWVSYFVNQQTLEKYNGNFIRR